MSVREEEPHLFRGIESLSAEALASFEAQLRHFDLPLLEAQRRALLTYSARISAARGAPDGASAAEAQPEGSGRSPLAEAADVADGRSSRGRKLAEDVSKAQHSAWRASAEQQTSWMPLVAGGRRRGESAEVAARGRALLREGGVGTLLLAGGVGTRLRLSGPKGKVAISPVQGKTLYQLFLERAAAASRQLGRDLPVALMLSPSHGEESLAYLEEHAYFGLKREQLFPFLQEELPYLDDEGHWLLARPGAIATGPEGNGYALRAFYRSGLWEEWQRRGIRWIQVCPIDNPLADPFDPYPAGLFATTGCELLLQCVPRARADEALGLLVARGGRPAIVEYSELGAFEPPSSGEAPFGLGYTGLLAASMEWIERVRDCHLPWHLAHKEAAVWDAALLTQVRRRLWKFETFIFDLLPWADRVEWVLAQRDELFAPLKTATGEHGVEAVQRALLEADRRCLAAITGLPPPSHAFELEMGFHYPTEELLAYWRGRALPPQMTYVRSQVGV